MNFAILWEYFYVFLLLCHISLISWEVVSIFIYNYRHAHYTEVCFNSLGKEVDFFIYLKITMFYYITVQVIYLFSMFD